MTKKLDPKAFTRAQHFLMTEARPLERTLFEFRFEGVASDGVLDQLAKFQNLDGGFGHALEADLRTPSSSALATGIGLRILKELGCTQGNPMVRRAVGYLLKTCDPQASIWQVAPPDTNDHPHAPWWHNEKGSLARTFDGFLIIPRAKLVGLLLHYFDLVPASWLGAITHRTVRDIEMIDDLGTGGGDDLVYALKLARTETLPSALRERLLNKIRQVIPSAVSRDPLEWSDYCIRPLKLAPEPNYPVTDLIWDDLQANLDYQIAHQAVDGAWDPVWTWGGDYPEAWQTARQEWRGCLTLETLTTLRAYGRLGDR